MSPQLRSESICHTLALCDDHDKQQSQSNSREAMDDVTPERKPHCCFVEKASSKESVKMGGRMECIEEIRNLFELKMPGYTSLGSRKGM